MQADADSEASMAGPAEIDDPTLLAAGFRNNQPLRNAWSVTGKLRPAVANAR